MRFSTGMKWLTGIFELVLGIPIFGAVIVIGSGYSVLGIMFVLHAITLVLSIKDAESKSGPIVGIVTSLIAWFPFVGMVMHLVSALTLMYTAYKETNHI